MKKILITLIIIFCSFTSNAQESKIIGNWQLTTVAGVGETETGIEVVFIFEDTGVLKAGKDITSRTMKVGTWKYNKQKKLLVLTSEMDQDFNGEATVLKLNDKELVYKKDKATFSFIKFTPQAKIEITMEKPILSFDRDDLFDNEEGFDEKAEARKLPWKITAIVNNLKNKNEVLFQYTSFPDSREAASWVVSTKFNYNEANQTLGARDYSYSQNDYIDMNEQAIPFNSFKENKEDFRFYPEEELDYYKVVSTSEILKTDLGDFECTVVEGLGGFSEKFQYWMVNNQPGIFAKIVKVKDQEPPFGRTTVHIIKEEPIKNSEEYNQMAKFKPLTFSEDDFYTEDGEFKYNNEDEAKKLPWSNWREIKKDILNIKQLVYSYDFNDEDNDVFENKILTTDVIANLEYEGFTIENIFLSYDTGGNEVRPNTDYNNPLYPLSERTYRVAGNEQITTPAGTFNCTIIEVVDEFERSKKLWMINDKLGIYAKIIDENTNEDYGYYHLYELQEIKLK